MINFRGRLINIGRSRFFVTLQKQMVFKQSTELIRKQLNFLFKCEMQSFFTTKIRKNLINLNSNFYSFGTFSNNRVKKSQQFQKPVNIQSNSNFQQQDYQTKKISQQFQKFIFDLQQIHQTDFQNYQKITHIIDKYINEKIFAYSSQNRNTSSDSDSESLTYFFQNEKLLYNYTTALNIKSSVDFRFRKYDQILTNIENQLYLLKFLKAQDKVQKTIQKLCNMYIFTLILHDHYKLKDLLNKNYNLIQADERSQEEQQRVRGRRVSRRSYQGPKSKSDQDHDQHQKKTKKVSSTALFKALKSFMNSQTPQCLLSRALSFAVLGQVEQSLSLFCQLLNSNRQNKILLGNFLSVYIFFGNESFVLNGEKNYVSSRIKDFVKTALLKQNSIFTVKTLPKSVSPQDSQYLLNSVLSFIKDQPLEWTDLPFSEIQQFSHSIYLIAENYYLSGEKQKAIKIIEDLKIKMQNKQIKLVGTQPQRKGRKLAQKTKPQNISSRQQNHPQPQNLQMLTLFFQLMRQYDQKDFTKIKQLQHTFSNQQRQNFYKFTSIPNDILRSNVYEILSQTYRALNDNEKADEYQQLSIGNHCVNNTYEANMLGDIDMDIQQHYPTQKPIQQDKKNKGIPPHYINFSRFLGLFQVKFM